MSNETPKIPATEADQGEARIPASMMPVLADALESISVLAGYASRNERRKGAWFVVKSTFLGLLFLSVVLLNLNNVRRMWGVNADPARDSVGIIDISGTIGSGGSSASNVIPLIEQACNADRVTELALLIDSPGGSPTDADRIVSALQVCREHDKPVVSIIGSLGASAAYMVAMNTDEVYASRYSLVGSIGAITRYVDASGLAERIGVTEQVFKSGKLKGGPSNLSVTSPEDAVLMNELVGKIADEFYEQLVAVRGAKLKGDRDLLMSGRIWTAHDAKALGLVDEIAVLEDLKKTRFKGKRLFRYRQKPTFMSDVGLTAETFGRSVVTGAKQAVLE